MAVRGGSMRHQGGSLFAGLMTLAAIIAVGVAASWVARGSILLLDSHATAAARHGLMRLAQGDPWLLPAELGGLALIVFVAIVQPLALVGLMLLIELTVGPRVREPKNYWLGCRVQVAFLAFAFLLDYALGKLGPPMPRPLIQVSGGDGLGELLLRTLPAYLLVLFVGDFFRYWFHRAQHRFAFLWRFHAVHHMPRDLDVLHNFLHPVELVGNVFLIVLPTALLIGVDAGQLYLVTVFVAVQGHIHHMNVPMHYGPLRHVLCDNRNHFVHHSCDPADYDTNFAAFFPVLDRLFGTYREPASGPLPATGLPGAPPTRLADYLLGWRPAAAPPTGYAAGAEPMPTFGLAADIA